jgi:hypothetical protein
MEKWRNLFTLCGTGDAHAYVSLLLLGGGIFSRIFFALTLKTENIW